MSLVSLNSSEGHGAGCGRSLYFVVRMRKLVGNAGWCGGRAFHVENAVFGSG